VLTLFVLLHIVICVFLILVVLLQSGRGADLAGAFGVSGSQTAFGPRGATTLLSKVTTWMAFSFMVTSLGLYIWESRRAGSAIREPAEAAAPAAAAAQAPAPAAGAPAAASPGDQIIEEETGSKPTSEGSAPAQP
jgi:preprotein translocase subunit SecG